MRKPTRRHLCWIGGILIGLPTLLLATVAIVTYFQSREYQSSVFIETGKPGVIHTVPADPSVFYVVLVLIGIYLPGLIVLLIAFRNHSCSPSASGSPHI